MTYVKNYLLLPSEHLQFLIDELKRQKYQVIGPRVQDGAIVYDKLETITDLPVGWTDEQEAGHYRLKRRADKAFFGYTLASQSWKRFLHPPGRTLWQAQREKAGFHFIEKKAETQERLALIGVRSCELNAIAIQDRIFMEGDFIDPFYQSQRKNLFVIAINCSQAGNTCFCSSMHTGPQVTHGFDLALTEIMEDDRHDFVLAVATEQGAQMMQTIYCQKASPKDLELVQQILRKTCQQMGRKLDTTDIKELLYQNRESTHWEEVATRCLSCANCTMVCPTCFCTTIEDLTDLSGQYAERHRSWDSCFTLEFSYLHGGSVRSSAGARYRQWLTHKLASWYDQFGCSGCVGCGRCITWCPVGIDITRELETMRHSRMKETT